MWRNPLSGFRRSERARAVTPEQADSWARGIAPASLPVMAEVEALALQVYAANGLPTQPGHYRRGPSSSDWLFLGEHIDASMKWAMVLEMPPEQGWRYASLEDLGRYADASAELRGASHLLEICRHLKARIQGTEPGEAGDDIETAIRLGVEWRALTEALAARGKSRLKLTRPVDIAPTLIEAKPPAKTRARLVRTRVEPSPDPGPEPKPRRSSRTKPV